MAIIKDLIEIGKQLQKLTTGYERLDGFYQSINWQAHKNREEVKELKLRLANIEQKLREQKILPKKHWWK